MPPSNDKSFHERLESLFLEAIELDPTARDRYLHSACEGNVELLSAVQALLRTDARNQQHSRWDRQAIHHEATLSALDDAHVSVDRYRLLALIGSGGMGAVYRAVRDDDSFSKVVALKIAHAAACDGPSGEPLLQRFRQERQILAQLEHPNIARLLDGGSTPDGRPFLVMDYVEGDRIDRHVAQARPQLQQLLGLFRKICASVSYAHSCLVIHRDIKPANILVSPDGEPKLLDFGVAKLLDTSSDAQTLAAGLTPRYASPEQFSGGAITTASDVYALGVLLYELLTGASPYLQADDPTKLHDAVIQGRCRTLRAAAGRPFPDDLECIVAMALRLEPGRRYQYVEQFSADIGRYLDNYPVLARPDKTAYRVAKYIRRNQFGVTAAAVVAGVLSFAASSVVSQRDLARRNEDRYHQLSYQASMTAAYEEWRGSNPLRTLELLAAQRPAPGETDLRGLEWYILWNLNTGSRIQREFSSPATSLSFSADGKSVAVGLQDGTSYYRAFPAGRTAELKNGSIAAIAPDGATLATGDAEGIVRLWEPATSTLLATFRGHSGAIRSLAFSPDGQTLCSTSTDSTARLWRVHSQAPPIILRGHMSEVGKAAFSPNGKLVATAGLDHTARLWNVSTGHEAATLRGHTWYVSVVDFSPDGSLLATSGSDGHIKLWNVATHREAADIPGDGASVLALRFSPDGKLIAAGTFHGITRLIDVRSRLVRETLPGHSAAVSELAFAPDGRTLFSVSVDRTFRSWDIAGETGAQTLEGHRDWIWDLKFSPGGTVLASAGKDATVKLWDIPGGSAQKTLQHQEWVNGIAFSPDGKLLASASDDQLIRLWDVSSGTLTAKLSGHASIAECAVFSPDGRTLATGGKAGEIILWDVAGRRALSTVRSPHGNMIWDLAFSPDGKSLAAAEGGHRDLDRIQGHVVTVWNPQSGALLATLDGHSSDVRALAFSPDGKTLATGSFDGTLLVWDFPARTLASSIKTHKIRSLAFSPDGSRIATAGHDKTVRLWNFTTRQEVLSLSVPNETAGVAFSPDGRRLAAGAHDGKIRIWTAAPPESAR